MTHILQLLIFLSLQLLLNHKLRVVVSRLFYILSADTTYILNVVEINKKALFIVKQCALI